MEGSDRFMLYASLLLWVILLLGAVIALFLN